MERASGNLAIDPPGHDTQGGVGLTEVLAAILIMGIGLLALLTLFPLGALEMAEAIKDDRTAAVAARATAFGAAGEHLIADTSQFVARSLLKGSVDQGEAARLRAKYEHFQEQAADLEAELQELRELFPPAQIQRYLGPLLAQIRAIRLRMIPVVVILQRFTPPAPGPPNPDGRRP
jgi:hypothetical protein